MKTIQFLAKAIELMKANGTPANIQVGTFKVESRGSLKFWAGGMGTFDTYNLSFTVNFRPDHIQKLFELGVNIELNKADRNLFNSPYQATGRQAIAAGRYYKRANGVCENWLSAPASCDIDTLTKLEKYCRDNHLHQVAISNDHTTGWGKSLHYHVGEPIHNSKPFYKKLRQNIANKCKKDAELLPVEKLALKSK